VSGERLWSEVKKTLAGNYAGELFITMLDVGIGTVINSAFTGTVQYTELVFTVLFFEDFILDLRSCYSQSRLYIRFTC
jgi:tRNA nucleotidyltransferase/poly(A) polymerase